MCGESLELPLEIGNEKMNDGRSLHQRTYSKVNKK